MIKIKNCKIFTVDINKSYHWSKLPKLKELMSKKYLDLQEANLSGANLSEANLSGAKLSGAKLFEAKLFGANLSEANLSGANLSGANLFGANLLEAKLFGANLSGAKLSGANLSGANLFGANLSGAGSEKLIIKDFISITGIGSSNRQTLFFKTYECVMIQCGCFYGSLEQFEKQVKETHKGNKHEKEYLKAIELIKIKFEMEE